MKSKTVAIHCSYSEGGKGIEEILLESFRMFLKKELLSRDIQTGLQYCSRSFPGGKSCT